jgi:type II secretory pathway component PulM
MARGVKNKIADLKGSWERLSQRERSMVGGLVAVVVVGVVILVGYIIASGLEELEENNEATRKALRDIEQNKDSFVVQRQRLAALEVRISRTPVELNRFLETAASAAGISIAESGEMQPVQGDRYTQRGMEIKLRKVNIEQLAKFMKEIETSQQLVQITSLSVNTRWNQHEELDVEMTVSTYERREGGGKGDSRKKEDRT